MDELHATAKAAEEFMKNYPMLSYAIFTLAGVFGWIARVLFAQGRKEWVREFVGFFVVGVPIAAFSGLIAFEYMVNNEYQVRMIIAGTAIAIYTGATLSLNIALWLYDIKIKEVMRTVFKRWLSDDR